jgi:hypothetical protein
MYFRASRLRRLAAGGACILFVAQGCSRFTSPVRHEYVYVWPKETYLRDRVAVVSNRVAEVVNGQRLEVVEEGHRFLKVKTDRGELGWIEDRGVIDQKIYDQFAQLEKEHAQDPVVGTAVLLDDYWLRDAPGRQSDRFYLLTQNSKLQLLARASVPKPEVAEAHPVPLRAEKQADGTAPASPPPDMEDYWLVRDGGGHAGWVRARTLEEDVPDAIAGLGEGQKIVGAYVLRTVDDPDANAAGGKVPEYVTVLAPWKDGLPYDFDQVRVFTWNVKKHRYETAYRERNIVGYLPITVGEQTFGSQQEPTFSYRVAASENAALDPATGMVKPADTLTESYHMEGVIVRPIGNPQPAHRPAANSANSHEKARKRRRGEEMRPSANLGR